MNGRSFLIHKKILICLFILLQLYACGTKPVKQSDKLDPYEKVRTILAQETDLLKKYRESRDDLLLNDDKRTVDLSPEPPDLNPLDDITIRSLTVDNGDIAQLLKALALETGTNLLLHPEIAESQQKITVNFTNIRASLVFKEIMQAADMHGVVSGNFMRVNPYEERIYSLDFIETNIEANFDMGGDVLGSNVGNSANEVGGLTGQFTISGSAGETNNPYEALNKIIDSMKTPTGSYALNRISGSLYIKDKPSVIRNISKMLDELKDMMSRQILIEARILEIQLDDGYQYGIDWALLSDDAIATQNGSINVDAAGQVVLNNGFNISNTDGFSGAGVVFSEGDWLGAVNVLNNFGEVNVISNPHIRARHGQPSMISVGRSNTFISKTETSTDTDTTLQTATIETDQVFDGLLLGVIPFIGDDKISLSIHPIKSDVDDESLNLISIQNASVSLPRVDLKEMSTTIKIADGDTVILGGLIDRRKETVVNGVPGVSSVPILGWLFKNESYKEVIREFVIVMKVRLV